MNQTYTPTSNGAQNNNGRTFPSPLLNVHSSNVSPAQVKTTTIADGDPAPSKFGVFNRLAFEAQSRTTDYGPSCLGTRWYPALREAVLDARCEATNVLLLEIDELTPSIIAELATLRGAKSAIPIIGILNSANPIVLVKILTSGVRACLIKPFESNDLIQAVQQVMNGSAYLCRNAQQLVVNCLNCSAAKLSSEMLSPREHEIVQHLLKQQSDKEIGQTLRICTGTVHVHLANVYKKLGVHSRSEVLLRLFGC